MTKYALVNEVKIYPGKTSQIVEKNKEKIEKAFKQFADKWIEWF